MASISRVAPIHLGLDVHKDTISVGILPADQQIPDVERITHDEASIRRLACRLGNPACYEPATSTGPTGSCAGPAAAQHGDQLPGDRAVAHPQSAGRQGPRPTGAIAGGWPGCTAPASWSPSASRPSRRRRCGIFVAPGVTWSKT